MTALPDTQWLELELKQGWLRIVLNDPASRNALSKALSDELKAVFKLVRNDTTVRGISVQGKGGVFCAGGDLKAFSALGELPGAEAHARIVDTSIDAAELFSLVHTAPQVVVVLIEGAAVAGGLGIACAADFAFATRAAVLSFSETRLGITPAQIAPYVVAKTGVQEARRLLLLGEKLDGAAAHRSGLVDKLADHASGLEELELELAEQVRLCAPGAIKATKNVIDDVTGLDLDAYQRRSAQRFADCLTSEEGREGVASFFAKRKPVWAARAEGEPVK